MRGVNQEVNEVVVKRCLKVGVLNPVLSSRERNEEQCRTKADAMVRIESEPVHVDNEIGAR